MAHKTNLIDLTDDPQLPLAFYDPNDVFLTHSRRSLDDACRLAGVPEPKAAGLVDTYLRLLVAGVDHLSTGTWAWCYLLLDGAPCERRISKPLGRGWRERLSASD